MSATLPSAIAQQNERPPAGVSSEEDYEILRRLLGLPSPPPTPEPAIEPLVVEPVPAVVQPPPPAPEPAPVPAAVEPPPATKAAPPPPPKPVKKAAPAKPAAKPAPRPAPQPVEAGPPAAEPPVVIESETAMPKAPEAAPVVTAPARPTQPGVELPAPGTVVSAKNLDQWKHLLGPSIQWAVQHNATLPIVETTPAPIEPTRQRATEKYSAQVKLAGDKLSMENYVAGIPFPMVNTSDPDIAVKLVFNLEARLVQDDIDLRHSECDVGSLNVERGVRIEKHYLTDHFRRLFYVSRMHHEPMPTWKTLEGVRYREMVTPIIEPLDLKGAGYTYARYLSPSRQDDSWVYYPMSRRVRRLSTAQRSEGIFGTDIDLDSFAGYSGNPAWMEWKYLGEKPILASMHARNMPVKYLPPPADYFPDDVWEARNAYVLVGTSKLPGGVFSRRVIYLDKEALLIPYAEIYDLNGGLWKGLVFTWKHAKSVIPNAKRAVYKEDVPFPVNFSLYDMQLDHVTRCASPSNDHPDEEGWYYNFGDEEGSDEAAFTVARVIGEAR